MNKYRLGEFTFMLSLFCLMFTHASYADIKIKSVPTQYIAALGDSTAKSGDSAETWGLWPIDPGPRGVMLNNYANLKASNNRAPAKWKFDDAKWWLEEHGLIMEQPIFAIAPGKYVVTGGRTVTAILTISPKGSDGKQHWDLDKGASLYDVTHLGCRAAVYTPTTANSCTPADVNPANFPVEPGAAMPSVSGCNKQDYQVLIVTGVVVEK